MADRRRRRRNSSNTESELSEGEDGPSTDSPKEKISEKDCESEVTQGEETSEYESTTEGPDEEDETETEDDEDDETTEDYDDEEDDVILEDDWIEEERQSGDGEEEPDKHVDLDDDEDKKNPAYIPRKGAFYEHDTRLSEDGKEADEQETVKEEPKPKQALWQDHGRWDHDKYMSDQQGPKSRDELIATYGYDIRSYDKPPEGVSRGNRNRRQGPDRSRQLGDYMQAHDDGYRGNRDRPSYGRDRGGGRGRGGPRPQRYQDNNRDRNRQTSYSDFKNNQTNRENIHESYSNQEKSRSQDSRNMSGGTQRGGFVKAPSPDKDPPPQIQKPLEIQSKAMPPDVVPKSHIIEAYHAEVADTHPNEHQIASEQTVRTKFRKGSRENLKNLYADSPVNRDGDQHDANRENYSREQTTRDAGFRRDGHTPGNNFNRDSPNSNRERGSWENANRENYGRNNSRDNYERGNKSRGGFGSGSMGRGGFGASNSSRGGFDGNNSNRGGFGGNNSSRGNYGGNSPSRGNYARGGAQRDNYGRNNSNQDYVNRNEDNRERNRDNYGRERNSNREQVSRDKQNDQYNSERRTKFGQPPQVQRQSNYGEKNEARTTQHNVPPLMQQDPSSKHPPGISHSPHVPPTTASVKTVTNEVAQMSIYPPVTMVTNNSTTVPGASSNEKKQNNPPLKGGDAAQNRPKRYSRQRPLPEAGAYTNEAGPEGPKGGSGPPPTQQHGSSATSPGYYPGAVFNPQTGVYVSHRPTVTQSVSRTMSFPHPPIIQPPLTNIPFSTPPSTMVQSPPHLHPRAPVTPATLSPSVPGSAAQPMMQGTYVAAPIVNYGPPHQGPPSHFQVATAMHFRASAPIQKAPFPPPPQITQVPRGQQITQLPQQAVTQLPQQAVTQLPQQAVTQLPQQAVTQLPQQAVTQLPQQPVAQLPQVQQVQQVNPVPAVQGMAQGPDPYHIHGGTVYFPAEAQPFHGHTGHAGHGGGTTYFSPHNQQPSPPRAPVSRRPKAAIPIINPQQQYQPEYEYDYQYDEAEMSPSAGPITDIRTSSLSATAQEFTTATSALPPGGDQADYDDCLESEENYPPYEETSEDPLVSQSESANIYGMEQAEEFVPEEYERENLDYADNGRTDTVDGSELEAGAVNDRVEDLVENDERTDKEEVPDSHVYQISDPAPDIQRPQCQTPDILRSESTRPHTNQVQLDTGAADQELSVVTDSSSVHRTNNPEPSPEFTETISSSISVNSDKDAATEMPGSLTDSNHGNAPTNQSKDKIVKEIKVVYTEARET